MTRAYDQESVSASLEFGKGGGSWLWDGTEFEAETPAGVYSVVRGADAIGVHDFLPLGQAGSLYATVGHNHDLAYLGISETATDSDLLEGHAASYFAAAGHTHAHSAITGLTSGDDHTQYAYLAGRTGGQAFIGGTGVTDDLILRATSGAGASGSDVICQVGNNGETEAWRALYDGRFGIGQATVTTGYQVDVNGFLRTSKTIDQESYASIYAEQIASTLQDGSASTGVNEPFDTQWKAMKFTASAAHNVRSMGVRLKASATLTNPTAYITAYLYTDVAGSPGASLGSTQVVRFGSLTTSMALYQFGGFASGPSALTSGASYWIVLKFSAAPTGGTISIDTAASGTGLWSKSTDGTTWTNEDSKTGYFLLYGRTYRTVYGSSTNNFGVVGESTNHTGVYGVSNNYFGVHGSSDNYVGVYGTSDNYVGVYGLSNNSYSGYFIRNTASPASAVPVCYVLQDHASDTNTAFRVTNDGTGYIQDWYNSTTLRAGLTAAGSLNINAIGSLASSALTVTPAAGYSLNVALSGAGDFVVNTNQLVVDTSTSRVGINNAAPSYSLDVTGDLRCTTGFGCNGTTPQTAAASGGALAAYGTGSYGFDTEAHASALYAMVVAIRAALVADGIMS